MGTGSGSVEAALGGAAEGEGWQQEEEEEEDEEEEDVLGNPQPQESH